MDPSVYADLKQRGIPMRLIGQDPRRVIVANNPDVIEKNPKAAP